MYTIIAISTHKNNVSSYVCTVIFVLMSQVSTYSSAHKPHRFKDLLSSSLYFLRSRSIRSLHPLPFRLTGFSSVENAFASVSAMSTQSAGLWGRLETTSIARAISLATSQRKPGIMNYKNENIKSALKRILSHSKRGGFLQPLQRNKSLKLDF